MNMFISQGKSKIVLRSLLVTFIFLFVTISNPISAQHIMSASKDGKWGYIDYWGNTVIPLKYDYAMPFNNVNRAKVKMGNKWGLINTTGKAVIPCQYDEMSTLNDFFTVKKGNRWGQIDKYGKIVVKLLFDTIATDYDISTSIAILEDKYCAYYKGKEIIPLEYDSLYIDRSSYYIIARKDEKYGVIDTVGQAVIPVKYKKIYNRWDNENYFAVTTHDENTFYTNPSVNDSLTYSEYIDTDLPVDNYKVTSYHDCDVYENPEGDLAIRKRFHTARPFTEGITMVTDFDLSRQCIDTLGNVLFDVPKGLYVHKFEGGFAECEDETTNKMGIINSKGEVIIEPVFDYIIPERNYFSVSKEGIRSFYDTTGRLLNYTQIRQPQGDAGMRFVEYNEKWGRVDSTFQEVIPPIYESIHGPSEGLILACKDNKWGYIDEAGTEVIPFIYDYAEFFYNGLAVVKYKGKCGIIDRKNRCRVKFEYDDIQRDGYSFSTVYFIPPVIKPYYPDREYEMDVN